MVKTYQKRGNLRKYVPQAHESCHQSELAAN